MLPRRAIIYAIDQADADVAVVFSNWCGFVEDEQVIEGDIATNAALFTFLEETDPQGFKTGYFPLTIICCDQRLITPKLKEWVGDKVIGFVDGAEIWSEIVTADDALVPECLYGNPEVPVAWDDGEGPHICPSVYDAMTEDDRQEFGEYPRLCRFEGRDALCRWRDDAGDRKGMNKAIRAGVSEHNYSKLAVHFFKRRDSYLRSTKAATGMKRISEEVLAFKRKVYATMIDLQQAADHPLTLSEVADALARCPEVRRPSLDGKAGWTYERVNQLLGELKVRDHWNGLKAKKQSEQMVKVQEPDWLTRTFANESSSATFGARLSGE